MKILTATLLVFLMAAAPVDAFANNKGGKKYNNRKAYRLHTASWMPAKALRSNARHIYFPDYNVYYDRANKTYSYLNRNRWVTSVNTPNNLRRVNLAKAYTVGIGTNNSKAYLNNNTHRKIYKRNRSSSNANRSNRRY